MKEEADRYKIIKSEIMVTEEIKRNVWIYMHILFFALFILGLCWSHNLLLVTYIVLIPFQSAINDYQYTLSKLSAYIQVFWGEVMESAYWNDVLFDYDLRRYYSRNKRRWIYILINSGVIHLGILSTGFYCGFILYESWINNEFMFGLGNISLMLLSIILFIFLCILNKDYYKDYKREFIYIMREYKKEKINSAQNDI